MGARPGAPNQIYPSSAVANRKSRFHERTLELATGFDPIPTYIPSMAPSKGNQQIRLVHANEKRSYSDSDLSANCQLVEL
jgi:hypothetical protein